MGLESENEMEKWANWKAGGTPAETGNEQLTNAAAIEKISNELRQGNTYERTILPDGRIELKNKEGETFFLEALDGPKEKEVHEIQQFMEKVFNPDEIDPEEVTMECLQTLNDPRERANYLLQMIKDNKGEVVGVMNAAYIPSRTEGGENSGYGVTSVGYVMVDPEQQGKGLARELYADLYERAGMAAQKHGEEMRFVVGEAVSTVEETLNKLGDRGRVYFKNAQGQWEEPQYVQPPLEYDADNGGAAEGAGSSPEHFMVGTVDGRRTITRDEFLTSVRSVYEYNNVCAVKEHMDGYEDMWAKDTISGKPSEVKSVEIIKGLYDTLAKQVGGAEEFRIFSAAERKQMKSQGEQFQEHKSADELEWDESGVG
ncbi:MAG: GNAT family N-acetyltransferase [Patescibacteria group bacterium]|jgi:GNAT superfamily N-acetyltransferase